MKYSLPLSLKVALWLALNLLLVAAGGLAVLVHQGGLGWQSLVQGPAGQRAQELGNAAATEAMSGSDAAAVLKAYDARYGAEFILFSGGPPASKRPIPPAVLNLVGQPGERGGPPPARWSNPERGPPPDREALGRFLVRAGRPPAYWLGVLVRTQRPGPPITLVMSTSSWWRLMRLLDFEPWLLAGAAVVFFSVLFWWPFVRSLTAAVRAVTAATQGIADGRFDTRVEVRRRDELGGLAAAVNAMAQRLDAFVRGQKRFLADVTHELNSPLGRLQVAMEIVESKAADAQRTAIADAREEVQQLSALVAELLAYTRSEMRPRAAALQSLPVAGLVSEVLRREDPGSLVRPALEAGLSVKADPGLLRLVLANLVRNAVRYGGPEGASLSARRGEEQWAEIAVADKGPGVPPEALARLGEPFYRPDQARARETGGVGLGLAILRSSVAACGGSVHFSNRPEGGFEALIRLPLG
jgi:two-component system sensor histidine kinase CpxA